MRALVLLAVFCFTPGAWAEEALSVELYPRVLEGEGAPSLVVRANTKLREVVLDLVRELDGKPIQLKVGSIAGGGAHRFELPLEGTSTSRFLGTLSVKWGQDEEGSLPIAVEAARLPKLVPRVRSEDIDLTAHKLKLIVNRPITKVEVSLMSDAGTPMGFTELEWGGTEVGVERPVDVEWTASGPGNLMRIHVKAYDRDGFFGGVELYPWRIEIPHEEVNFATGSFEIARAEAEKLEKSHALLRDALAKYGRFAKVQLFVAGHTDSVGDTASNRVLSGQRAKAISEWFRKRGVKVNIFFAGFGEEQPRVKTPDETDEPANRRAEYIVAVEPPSGAAWQQLR